MHSDTLHFTEAAIFGRVIRADSDDLPGELARYVLSLGISGEDQQRVEALVGKAQEGTLTEAEQAELENLNHVADLLSLWHSKARRALRKTH